MSGLLIWIWIPVLCSEQSLLWDSCRTESRSILETAALPVIYGNVDLCAAHVVCLSREQENLEQEILKQEDRQRKNMEISPRLKGWSHGQRFCNSNWKDPKIPYGVQKQQSCQTLDPHADSDNQHANTPNCYKCPSLSVPRTEYQGSSHLWSAEHRAWRVLLWFSVWSRPQCSAQINIPEKSILGLFHWPKSSRYVTWSPHVHIHLCS